ncbi:MAG: MFS transporter [Anaerolineae bacterium]|nr:MFS transporter [Anaerolineae bacterium]
MSSQTVERTFIPLSTQRRNIRFVAFDGMAIGLMSAAASFISVFVIRLGATPLWVGLLSSIPAFISLTMAIPWAQFAARQTKPQRVFAIARAYAHAVYILLAVIPFFITQKWVAQIIVIVWSLAALPGSLQNVMFSIVMGYSVSPDRRSFLMSRRWMFMGIVQIASMPLIGQLIERVQFPLGYQIAFGINIIFAVGAYYFGNQLDVPERERVEPPKSAPLLGRIKQSLVEIWEAKAFLAFISGRAIRNLGIAMVSAIIPIYWVNHLYASDAWVGYFNTALSAATLLAYLPWVRLKHKIGTWQTLLLSVLGTSLYPALLALTRSPLAVLPVIAFQGMAGAGLNLAYFDTLLDTCPPDRQERFIAINVTAVNITSFLGPTIGAGLLAIMPIRWVLVSGSAVALIGLAIFIFVGIGKKTRVEGTP